jgi:hypothetical protein
MLKIHINAIQFLKQIYYRYYIGYILKFHQVKHDVSTFCIRVWMGVVRPRCKSFSCVHFVPTIF